MAIETDIGCSGNATGRRSAFCIVAALIVTFASILLTSPPARSQTVDEMANPEEALKKCLAELKEKNDKRARYDALGCYMTVQDYHRAYPYWVQKANEIKPRAEQANTLSVQWQERYNLLTPLFERAEAECRSSYVSFSAACQSRDRYKQQRDEAASNQRKAEEIGKRLSEEYRFSVENRDGWARSYQACKDIGEVWGPDYTGVNKERDQLSDKCDNLEALVQLSSSGRTSGPTTPQTTTRKPQTTTKAPAPTTRTVKIGYVNYQKLPGFTVTVKAANSSSTQTCSNNFDTSRPFRQGEGDCSFEVPAGPCSINVQASGCRLGPSSIPATRIKP